MEQQREKRKERRNEQLVAALADIDQERWHQQGPLSPQSAGHGAVRRNWRTCNKHVIPEKHRDKVFITFDQYGNYTISSLILTFHAQ